MKLSKEDVLHLAELSRIELTESEVESFREECSSILDYVDRLQQVKVEGVDMHVSKSRGEGEWRPDVPMECSKDVRRAIRKAFPDTHGDLLKTPAIFERPKKEKRT